MNDTAIIGRGRLGHALSRALRASGLPVAGPLGRGADVAGYEAVLLCVPDGQIAVAAAAIAPGPLVGHCSGATGLDVLAGHRAFSVHPLMTVPAEGPHAPAGGEEEAAGDRDAGSAGEQKAGEAAAALFAGAGAAVAGSTPAALRFAHDLAARLGLRAVEVADEDRAAYHAAASVASNFLVTLEAAAERLLGHDRELLVPLVRATVENWAALGPEAALTGPVARGDEATVARQRAAVAETDAGLLPLFDALVERTRGLAARAAVAA
jgi:predicted short-subunit dehydrogenase-like oxidoreductase (DUF2520 family)